MDGDPEPAAHNAFWREPSRSHVSAAAPRVENVKRWGPHFWSKLTAAER
jgi:hypothetical protein